VGNAARQRFDERRFLAGDDLALEASLLFKTSGEIAVTGFQVPLLLLEKAELRSNQL
jgi:hypothetical protein